MKTVLGVLIILLSPLGLGIAWADSDGYYCAGPGYLAYQFGFAAPPVSPHRLHIVRIGGTARIRAPIVFELPQFQVHGMLCDRRSVRLAAYDAIYTVTLDDENQPVRYDKVAWADKGHVPKEFIGQARNLGTLGGGNAVAKPIRETLEPRTPGGTYVLEVTAKSSGPIMQCRVFITSRVVEIDGAGREVSERILFQGPGRRECGE